MPKGYSGDYFEHIKQIGLKRREQNARNRERITRERGKNWQAAYYAKENQRIICGILRELLGNDDGLQA